MLALAQRGAGADRRAASRPRSTPPRSIPPPSRSARRSSPASARRSPPRRPPVTTTSAPLFGAAPAGAAVMVAVWRRHRQGSRLAAQATAGRSMPGRPLQRRRAARRAGQLHRRRRLSRSARRNARGPARRRPGHHEPRRFGQVSGDAGAAPSSSRGSSRSSIRAPAQFPCVDQSSASWRKALAITRLAVSNAVPSLANDVLWYHADYVAPSWGRRLTRVSKIGTHIFYRA